MGFQSLDFYRVDDELSDEEKLARDTVREFVDREFLPRVVEHVRQDGSFPLELIPKMAELGLFGANLHGYDCAGMNNVAYGLVMQELERGDSGLRSCASVQGSLCMYPIHAYGTESQKQRWLPPMARGEAIGCFGLTEPDFGSNPAGMRTRARRDASGDWILNGTKMWITNAPVADVAVVWAQTDEAPDGKGIRGFVVPTDTPGFSAPVIKQKLSLRASVTGEIVLDDVRLPESAAFPEVRGLKGPLSCLNEARFGIVFGAVGAARDCLESAIAYAASREIYDKPLAGFQITQTKLADMTLELGKAMLLALHLGRLKDEGTLRSEQISLGKLNNVREAIAIARECRTILAAAGVTLEYPILRHANNLESVLTYEGTSEVHQLIIGQALTGESAFR